MTDDNNITMLLHKYSTGDIYDLWTAELPKIKYIVYNLIPTSQVNMFFGAPESGKSTLLLYLALCVASGKDSILGKTIQQKVLYIDEEMGPIGLQLKIKAIVKAMGINMEKVKGNFSYKSLTDFKLDDAEGNGVKLLKNYILIKGIKVIFIDSLFACTVGDMNTLEMRKLRNISLLSWKNGISINYTHHMNKVESEKPTLTLMSIFGSVVIPANIDNAFGFVKFKEHVRIQQLKGRYIPPDEKIDINIPFNNMVYGKPINTVDLTANKYIGIINDYNKKHIGEKTYTDYKVALVDIKNGISEPTLSKYLKRLIDDGELLKVGDKYV